MLAAVALPLRRGPALPDTAPHPDQPRPLAGKAVSVHDPVLPVWSCGGCALPWPGPTRRRELRAEFDGAPVSLALYLGAQLVRASADLTWLPAGGLHRRFLGWLR